MVDIEKMAKHLLLEKGMREKSKLTLDDILNILIEVMKDASITKSELYDLAKLRRYTYGNMDDEAVEYYNHFMDIFQGKKSVKRSEYNLLSFIEKELKKKKKINLSDIQTVIILIMDDGILSRKELEELQKISKFQEYIDLDAWDLFSEFYIGLQEKVFVFEQQQIAKYRNKQKGATQAQIDTQMSKIRGKRIVNPNTAVHDLSPDAHQCGSCYGSGRTTCGSCGGMGGQYSSRVEYDYEGNTNYVDDYIPCSCSGGYNICGSCGGSGSVYR